MTTVITHIEDNDLISDGNEVINNNCDSLNANKIETSVISTDSTFSGASDAKIASQLATKLYVDSGGNQNASETTRGIVQEATDAQVTAGTATGATGAKLFVTPAKLATRIASFTAPIVRTYLNAASPATWTKPAGLNHIVVEVQAGGANGSAGGGAGGYSKKTIVAASLGATETVTIGAVAGNSSFGTHATANGATNKTGGTAASGDINIQGEDGCDTITGFFESTGRGNARSGRGGSSMLGKGGSANGVNGGDAHGYGAGGATAGNTGSGPTSGSSGAGTAGIVIVTEYYV